MNAITNIPTNAVQIAIPAEATPQDWLGVVRSLFDQKQQADWMLADCLASGAERFGMQTCLDLIVENIAVEPKVLRSAARVAEAFPAHLRASDMPYDVHRLIAQLPEDRRLETLQRASVEHWGVNEVRRVVHDDRKQQAMFEDNDPERFATLIFRAWNNAPSAEVRELAWARISHAARNGFTMIDEEVLIDDEAL